MKQENMLIIRSNCLKNSNDFITAAKTLALPRYRHIKYHLAALALEEIGKSELIVMQHVLGDKDDVGFEEGVMDDHVKKLFWAFWGPSFGKKLITQDFLDTYKGLAQSVHWRRLNSLYTNPKILTSSKNLVTQKQADALLSLAEARLKMERASHPDFNLSSELKENASWFLKATKDVEKRKLILGKSSQEKLIELNGDVKKWISWLKELFETNDADIRKMVEEEMLRQKPSGDEAKKPKYRVKIRIHSESHSIRNKVLKEWNEKMDLIKLNSDDKRTLFCTFIFTKSMPPTGLFHLGWGMARAFVTAINISTRGFFWWNLEKDTSKYYEEMWDIEKNLRMEVKQKPALELNWKELGWKLEPHHLLRASKIFYFITISQGKEMEQALGHYAMGLTLIAKNDIHLRMESSAFRELYLSFKESMRIAGDWDSSRPINDVAKAIFSKIGDFKDLDEAIEIGEEVLTIGEQIDKKRTITLTEVFGMKLFSDIYFEILADRDANLKAKERLATNTAAQIQEKGKSEIVK